METYEKLQRSNFILTIGNKVEKRIHIFYLKNMREVIDKLKEYREGGVIFDETTTFLWGKQDGYIAFNSYVMFSEENVMKALLKKEGKTS